jgi:deoxyribodipyrimidine photolyase-related protein
MYWFLGPDYRENNQLNATRKLPPLFSDPNKTQMNCIKETVTDIQSRAQVKPHAHSQLCIGISLIVIKRLLLKITA